MVYAANEYLAPVEAGAQELACVPSWADACSSVEVAVSDDQLMIHVPNGGFPRTASERKRPTAPTGFRSSSAWSSGSETPAALPIDAERISAPTGVLAGGPALAGLRVLSSTTGGVCASADTPGCVDVTDRWLAVSDTTAELEEEDDDDPCVVDDDDEEGQRSLEQRAVAEDDSSDVVPCAAYLPAGSTGSLLNPITFLLPVPPIIGILAGGDPAPTPTDGTAGGLDGGDDGGSDGGTDGGSDGATDGGTTGGTDGGSDGGTTGGGTRTMGGDGGDDGGTDGGSDGGTDGWNDDGGSDGGSDGGNDDGGTDGGNDDGGTDGGDGWPTDDGGGTPPMSEVPEPVSTTLMGLGLASWAAARARQRRKGSAIDPGAAEDPLD
jgi:hypothetical protein